MSVREPFERLETDPWREAVGFSAEIEEANRLLFRSQADDSAIISTTQAWLQKYQPCLFGRIAARLNLITYCILRESDLEGSDDHIAGKIQEARGAWLKDAFSGGKSGFVILVVSPRIAAATPGAAMLELASRLTFLYLQKDIHPDQIFVDQIYLEAPTDHRATWVWDTGINYFSAQGDGRWWHDHRIPGGMALSINSVGHMTKSGIIAKHSNELADVLGLVEGGRSETKVDSLGKSLDLAMRTIAGASTAVSGKATRLLPLPVADSENHLRQCPVELPRSIQGSNFCEYEGDYHTDYTLPSEYFMPDVERPSSIRPRPLDFTYLFDDSVDNPDHIRMGTGRRIRSNGEAGTGENQTSSAKIRKANGRFVQISDCPQLVDLGIGSK